MKTDEIAGKYQVEENDESALAMFGKGYNSDPIPPTEFTSTLSGFTPAPDVLIQEFGYVTALVWGRAWRYCQMIDGVCRASLEKLGAGLGMSERTIIRHLETLCEGGYLFDTTPDLKNKPHIYADTGKIRIRFNVETGVTQSQRAMTQSQRAMTQSQRQGDRESVEESIKDREIFDALEKLTGSLNSNTPRFVDTWLEKHAPKYILQAIETAFQNKARSVKYVDEILISWEANGYPKTREEKVQQRKVGFVEKATESIKRSMPTFDENGRVINA